MTGYIENNRVYVDLEVYGLLPQLAKTVKIQVDTGYDGHLILPFNEAIPLGLILKGTQSYTLADGNNTSNLVCWGNINVDGNAEFVPIDVGQQGNALLGQAFLKQANVIMEVDYSTDKVTFTVVKKPEPKPLQKVAKPTTGNAKPKKEK